MMLMARRTFSVIKFLKRETTVDSPSHHVAEAQHTPVMNEKLCSGGSDALNAPRSIVPSMIAWGLNHVTTHAVVMILAIGIETSVSLFISTFDRMILIPI